MEFLLYTVVGVGLYWFSDWLLLRIEGWRGEPFEQRTLVFFVIILVLALASFEAIGWLLQR